MLANNYHSLLEDDNSNTMPMAFHDTNNNNNTKNTHSNNGNNNMLLGDKTPFVLNQQNNNNNNNNTTAHKSSAKILRTHNTTNVSSSGGASASNTIQLNAAGINAIQQQQQQKNSKMLNFQNQQQTAVGGAVAKTTAAAAPSVVAPVVVVPAPIAPFGVRTIPLPAISANPTYLLPPLDHSQPETHPVLTVVFDLDETLVYNRHMHLNYALLRPYALHLLNALSQMPGLELVLWTASTQDTAEPVVRQLHERGDVFDHCVYRNPHWFTDPQAHTKDLRLLGRDMNRVVIIDNQPNCVKLNATNAILVEDYLGGSDAVAMQDASLVNLYYIIDFITQNLTHRNMNVAQTLESLANETDEASRLCGFVGYHLPAGWEPYHVQQVRPLSVPAHGTFVRTCLDTPAPLDSWTI